MLDNKEEKNKFWLMVNVTMELCNKPPVSKEAIITWWNILQKYEFEDVQHAFDEWVNSSKTAPTPRDIKDLCQPKVTIHARLPSPLSKQANAEYAKEVVDYVKDHVTPKRDMKSWARKILASPKNYPDISVKFAKEALNMEEV